MTATLIFYNYYRKQQRDITAKFLKTSLLLEVERVNLDKLVVEMGTYSKEDFESLLVPYRNNGRGGITIITYTN